MDNNGMMKTESYSTSEFWKEVRQTMISKNLLDPKVVRYCPFPNI